MIVFRVGFGFQLKRKFLSGKVAPAVYGSESPSCLLIRSSWWGRHNWRSNQKHGRNWKSEKKGRNFDLFFSQCPLKLSSWSTHLVANIWVRYIMWPPMLNHLLAGCDCWGWNVWEDKFALEDQQSNGGGIARFHANHFRYGRFQIERHLHWICWHSWSGGICRGSGSVLPWRCSFHCPLHVRQSLFPRQCEVRRARVCV